MERALIRHSYSSNLIPWVWRRQILLHLNCGAQNHSSAALDEPSVYVYNDARDAACLFFPLLNITNVRQVIFLLTLLSSLTFVSSSHLHELFLATSCPPWQCPRCACKPSVVPPHCCCAHPGMSTKAWRGVAYRKPLKPDPSWWKIDVNVQTSTSPVWQSSSVRLALTDAGWRLGW